MWWRMRKLALGLVAVALVALELATHFEREPPSVLVVGLEL